MRIMTGVIEMHIERTILIIDGSRLGSEKLYRILKNNYNVLIAETEVQGIKILSELYESISVIILDTDIPDSNGLQLLEKLKCNYKEIPVIITSQTNEAVEAKALEMGAADFILKPYNSVVVTQRVYNVLAQSMLKFLNREKELIYKIEEMRYKAEHDSLTGLYNRVALETRINTFFSNNKKAESTFIMIDIDNFKTINDVYGHDKGDDVLVDIAIILKEHFTQQDTVSRLGGDEFAVFMPTTLSKIEIDTKIGMLCKKLQINYGGIDITATIGVCVATKKGTDYQTLYKNADTALLAAKRLGKNQFKIFNYHMEMPSPVLSRNLDWLLDESSDGIMVCDTENFDILYINHSLCEMLKAEKNNVLGKKCYEALWGNTSPCSHCVPLNKMSKTYCTHEIKESTKNKNYVIKGKLTEWGGKTARIQYVQDNTEQAKTTKILNDISRDRKRLLDLMPGGIFRYNADETNDSFDFISKNMLKMLGYTRKEFNAKFENKFSNLVWHEDRERVLNEINTQIAVGDTDECVYRIEKSNGELCWVHDVGHLVKDENNNAWYYVTILDITAQKQMQAELEDERKKLQIAILHSGFHYWEQDVNTGAYVGELYDGDSDIANRFSNIFKNNNSIPAEYISLYKEKQRELHNGADFVCYDIPVVNENGEEIWWRVRCTNLFDDTGKPVKIIGTAEDINKLKEYKKRYEALVHESDVQTFVLDVKGRCITDNIGLSRECGYDQTIHNVPESLITSGNIHQEDIEKFRKMYEDVYNGASFAECVSRWRVDANGNWRTTRVRLTTIFDKNNHPIKAFGTSKIIK